MYKNKKDYLVFPDDTFAPIVSAKVKEYAALGYSPERISTLLGFSKKFEAIFLLRIRTPGDSLYVDYHQAATLAQVEVDRKLKDLAKEGDLDAIKADAERTQERLEYELRHKYFGI